MSGAATHQTGAVFRSRCEKTIGPRVSDAHWRLNDMAGFAAAVLSAQSLEAVRTGQQIELILP